MNKKKRILIVTHFFPPLNSIASHRPYSWARTWADMGHEVHVLTTEKYAFDGPKDLLYDCSGFHVHVVPYLPKSNRDSQYLSGNDSLNRWERLKKISRRLRSGLGLFGDLRMLAYFKLVKLGGKLLAKKQFDMIISSFQPELVHFVGCRLAVKFDVPWVADYRDMWFKDISGYAFRITSWLVGYIEVYLLQRAALVSTVSEGLAKQIGHQYGKSVFVCYNGYVVERRQMAPVVRAKKKIVYTGRFYKGLRDPSPLFRALSLLKKNIPNLGELVSIDIYGYMDSWVDEAINLYGVEDCVQLHGMVTYEKSISAQRDADLLLFLDWMDEEIEGVLTGKLFEYLGIGCPVISFGPSFSTEAAKIIQRCQAGVVVDSVNGLVDFLGRWLQEGSAVLPQINHEEVALYSRENQAKCLLECFLMKTNPESAHN